VVKNFDETGPESAAREPDTRWVIARPSAESVPRPDRCTSQPPRGCTTKLFPRGFRLDRYKLHENRNNPTLRWCIAIAWWRYPRSSIWVPGSPWQLKWGWGGFLRGRKRL